MPGAHSQGHTGLAKNNRIAFYKFRHAPGKQQILHLIGCRLAPGDRPQISRAEWVVISGLYEQTRTNALEVQRMTALQPGTLAPRGQGNLKQAHIGLGLKQCQRLRGVSRRHQHFDKLLGDLQRGSLIQCAVERNDAAKGRAGVSLPGAFVSAQRIRTQCDAAGVGMLDDDTGRC